MYILHWSCPNHTHSDSVARCSCKLLCCVLQVYADQDEWTKRSILYTAGSGKFSSDRTIYEYAKDIWDVKPVPVPSS